MTIKVAKDGYEGRIEWRGGLKWINGELCQLVGPELYDPLWVPVRSYDGPVEHVDKHGRPIPSTPAPEVPA